MNSTTQQLHDLGQSLWLDNISRELLSSGTLSHYIDEFSVTGLTSNPTIFEHAISSGDSYDEAIGRLSTEGLSGEGLFFALALEDLTQAADLFRPIHVASDGVDGWVSLEVSPLLADDSAGLIVSRPVVDRSRDTNLFLNTKKAAATTAHGGRSIATDRLPEPQGVTGFTHVMHAQDGRTALRGEQRRGDTGAQALVDRTTGELPEH